MSIFLLNQDFVTTTNLTFLTDLGLGQKTLVMGILNTTPDSFSDGGSYFEPHDAVQRALALLEDGADIIDIGGESTRPATFHDATPLSVEEELKRVLPVIHGLIAEAPQAVISIDTYKAEVADRALDAGASIINDVSGLTFDVQMASVAARWACPVVIMHLLGKPRNIGPAVYNDVVDDIMKFFTAQTNYAVSSGIALRNIILDPGIGFAKTLSHNVEIIRRLSEFKELRLPILVGPSRKAFIGSLLGGLPSNQRLEGTIAAVVASAVSGADIVRVHDVREVAKALKVADAIIRNSIG